MRIWASIGTSTTGNISQTRAMADVDRAHIVLVFRRSVVRSLRVGCIAKEISV